MNIRVCIGIPVYNNPETLAGVVQGCLGACNFPILIIDDGSDKPAAGLIESNPRVKVIRHEKNYGKGAAIQTAFNHCTAEGFTHLITIDADGQHFPNNIPTFVEEVIKKPWDIIIGARKLSDAPTVSKFGKEFSNFWVWVQTGIRVDDSQSGFRAYPLFCIQTLKLTRKRYDCELEILVKAAWRNVSISSVDIDVYYPSPDERVSHFDKWWDNVRISTMNTALVCLSVFYHFKKSFSKLFGRQRSSWSGKTRGGWFGNNFLRIVSWNLGLVPTYLAMSLVVPYFYLFAPGGRRASNEYFQTLFPEVGFLKRQLFIMKHFYTFSTLLLDRLHQLGRDKIVFQCESDGSPNCFASDVDEQVGRVILGAHFGGLEIAAEKMIASFGGEKLVKAAYQVDQKSSFHGMAKSSVKVVEATHNDSVLLYRELLQKGRSICFLADRPMTNQFELVPFLGKLAAFDTTPFRLAASTEAKVVYTYGIKESLWCYKFRASLPNKLQYSSDDRDRSVQLSEWIFDYVSDLEQVVKSAPYQWANFYPFWSSLPNSPLRNSAGPLRCNLDNTFSWKKWCSLV